MRPSVLRFLLVFAVLVPAGAVLASLAPDCPCCQGNLAQHVQTSLSSGPLALDLLWGLLPLPILLGIAALIHFGARRSDAGR
jgi:hypothetical protein